MSGPSAVPPRPAESDSLLEQYRAAAAERALRITELTVALHEAEKRAAEAERRLELAQDKAAARPAAAPTRAAASPASLRRVARGVLRRLRGLRAQARR